MAIEPVSSSLATPTGATRTNVSETSNSLNYDAFLKLLVAEMKNQDPTEPMDSTEYMAQLASFSSVEQEIKANAKLDQVVASLAMMQAPGVIGKTITSSDGTLSGKAVSVQFFSDKVEATLDNGSKVVLGPGVRVSQ